MTSLFGSYAIKQSLGAESILGKMHFDHPSTSSVSIAPMRNDATPLPSSEKPPSPKRASLEEQLFEARATAKILASRVAMYMEDEWRRKLYRQLDSLLDVDEWMEGERPLVGDSFNTFLRLMLFLKPRRRPGFGLTSDGNLLALWAKDDARITLECRPDDQVRFVASHRIEGERETGAIDTTIARIPELARSFGLDRLYSVGPN